MYHDIAEQLIQDILAGQYPVKLPTEQVLMDRYQASRNTIGRHWMWYLPMGWFAGFKVAGTMSLIIRLNPMLSSICR